LLGVAPLPGERSFEDICDLASPALLGSGRREEVRSKFLKEKEVGLRK